MVFVALPDRIFCGDNLDVEAKSLRAGSLRGYDDCSRFYDLYRSPGGCVNVSESGTYEQKGGAERRNASLRQVT